MRPVAFLDTETTGRDRFRRPWEIAIIRRDHTDERAVTIFVALADLDLDHADPEALDVSKFYDRHPQFDGKLSTDSLLCSGAEAAAMVHAWTHRARVYGVVPSFDTECLDQLLHRHHLEASWHFQPWDMAVYASGYLAGRGLPPQYSSETTSRACGVEPPQGKDRHTAMGDALWVKRWYDKIVTPQPISVAA
ncbi:hypothetical protein LT337_33125 (plasmid) [Mycolicibacterium fortuitum]|uniref:hypothetical protein n=1 Tax=Mycolicibacterium conceptionense TaxID=451644 RepID=UPI00320477A7|nr:hypothetical protein LT337_33125 [Mycolicibacterium fortuitum]